MLQNGDTTYKVGMLVMRILQKKPHIGYFSAYNDIFKIAYEKSMLHM